MLREGAEAPAVSVPGYVDGERRRVDLDEYLGEDIVVLAFYPADFNPGCTARTADLGDLDVFAMQKDVSVFAVSPDSTFSHAAFADRYGLNLALLSDTRGEATAAYDVPLETPVGESLCRRAVFVVDHHGVVRFARATDDLAEQVEVEPVRQAVGAIGGDETAVERYRAGNERYAAARDTFLDAMAAYEERDWSPASEGLETAATAFAAAADRFDSAARFAETDDFEAVVDRAEEKADTLRHAADWLGQSADALGEGRGRQASEYRADAERLLSAAGDLPEPPANEAVALTDDGVDLPDGAVDAGTGTGTAAAHADLALDDEALDAGAGAYDGDLELDLDGIDDGTRGWTAAAGDAPPTADAAAGGGGLTRGGASEPDRSGANDDATGGEDAGEVDELDLTDPTDGDDEDDGDEDPDGRTDWDVPGC